MWSWCKSLLAVAVIVCAVASSGCGYALAGRGNFLPDYIQIIGIPTFQNNTSFFALAELVTDRIRAEFINRGNYKIVPEQAGSHAVLNGTVSSVSIIPASISADQQASRYIITVIANVELRDTAKDTVLWSNGALAVREEYDATSATTSDPNSLVDPSTFFNQETNAVERVSNEFARTVVSAILEAF
jgi:hypothetical protein